MQILLTVAALVPESGGPSRSIPALADALAGQGKRVRVVALDFRQRFGPPLLPKNPAVQVTLVPCESRACQATRYCRSFARTLRNCAAASDSVVLHDNGMWLGTNYIAARVASSTATPLVISPRGMLTEWAVRHHGLTKRLAWWAYQKQALASATLLHATSHSEAEDLRRLGCRQRIAVIPNGVSMPDQDLPRAESPTRRALFLSRLHPKKGLFDLIAAWSDLRPPGWELVIAGNDHSGHGAKVAAAARAAGLGDKCRLIGAVRDDEKWACYAASDLFVLPSYSENFGLVVAEALGCGVPVITTTATPWTEVKSRQCGWCVPAGRDSLRKALSEALSLDRKGLREMGRKGRAWVRSKFSWDNTARQLGEVYSFLLGIGHQPDTIQ